MRFFWRLGLVAFVIGVAAACSVGGGGSAPPPTNISGGSTSNSKVKASLAVKLHIPAASASSSSRSRATAAVTRGGRVRPQLISTASNGLSIQGYTTGGVASGQEFDFDISSTSSICSSDGAGGRTCTITITETAGSYYFVVATYASTPLQVNGNLSTQPVLDSGTTATYALATGTTSTITVTLGGSVAKISLNVPPSVDGYATSATVPIGVVTYDSAGEIIISSAAYATPVTINTGTNNSSVSLSTLTVTPQSGNGSPSTGGDVTSNYPSDVITLNYAYAATSTGAPVGASVSVTASGGSATTASGTLSPLFITDSLTDGAPTPTSPPVFAVTYPTAGTADTITISEAGSSVGAFAITADPLNGCGTTSATAASNTNPFLFAYNNGTPVTIPPASVAASGGTGTFTVDTTAYGSNISGACVYDIADTSGTVIPVSFSTSYSSQGSGQYTANVPGGLLYVTAVQGTYIAPNAVASPGYIGSLVGSAVLMYAPSAPTTTYQINDPTLEEPLGIAHDLAGDVFVADYAAHIINEYTPTDIAASPAPVVTPYASYTYPNPVPSGQPAPDGLAFNTKTSTLYVADNQNGYIAELSASQLLPPGETPQAHRGGPAATVRNPVARRRALSTSATITAYFYVGGNPAGLAFDSADDLFVSFPNTGTVSEYAPVDGDTGGGTFSLTPIANFTGTSIPSAIAIASGGAKSGDLYVFDAGGTGILDFFSPSNIAAPTSSGFGYSPAASAFAVDSAGNVYTTSNPPGSQTTSPSQVNIIENGGTPVPLGPAFPAGSNSRTLYIPFATF